MNKGIEILIKRMESNPQEFEDGGKWQYQIDCILRDHVTTPFLDKEDIEAFRVKYNEIQAEAFTESVVEAMFREEKSPEEPVDYAYDPATKQATPMGNRYALLGLGTITNVPSSDIESPWWKPTSWFDDSKEGNT